MHPYHFLGMGDSVREVRISRKMVFLFIIGSHHGFLHHSESPISFNGYK